MWLQAGDTRVHAAAGAHAASLAIGTGKDHPSAPVNALWPAPLLTQRRVVQGAGELEGEGGEHPGHRKPQQDHGVVPVGRAVLARNGRSARSPVSFSICGV